MSERCIPVEELASVLALPADHARRRHVDSCARCQANAALLRDFEAPAVRPGEARFDSADASLRRSIEALTGVSTDVPAAAAREQRTAWQALADGFAGPRLRLAGALAVVVLAGVVGAAWWASRPSTDVMRSAPSGSATAAFASEPAEAVEGGLELRWNAMPGATSYEVVLLGEGLREVGRLAPTTDTHVVLRAADRPAGLAPGAAVAWQVEARSGTDVLASTGTRAIDLP